jgi:hypothetical protein
VSESIQERLEREAEHGMAKDASLIVLSVHISVVKGKIASDKALDLLLEELGAVVDAWAKALPRKGTK